MRKKATGLPSITYPEALDEALCFGWIDGVRKRLNAQDYTVRFTPRRARSTWSHVNTRRAAQLEAEGRMTPSGLAAFTARRAEPAGSYSFERARVVLSPSLESAFRRHRAAWEFFCQQPAGYRRTALWWVSSAKKEETRQRRLNCLMRDSAARRRLAMLAS